MKRKLALLLAGCLAISPAAAGCYPAQAFAAETVAGSESGDPIIIAVSVKDENGTALTAIDKENEQDADTAKYSIPVGETRQFTAIIEQGEDFPALSVWSSETPEVIDIDDDGFITAKSAGKGLITLSISNDVSQNPIEYKFEIIVSEPEIQISEEITEVTEDTAPAPAEAPVEAAAAAEVTEETAAEVPAAEVTEETAAEVPTAEVAEETAAADTAAASVSGDPIAVSDAEPAEAATDSEVDASSDETADAASDEAAASVSGDPVAVPDAEPANAAADSEADAAAAPDASVSGDPAAAAATDPIETVTASVAMDAAVETGNTSSKVNANQGPVVTPHWEGGGSSAWRYIKNDGSKATGKMTIGGKIYIFNSAGDMCTGWTYYQGAWYYLEQSGEARTGWLKEGRDWYYLTGDGSMKTGRLDLGSSSFIFNNSGRMLTGWAWYGGRWYYLDSNGYMKKGWLWNGGHWYYLDASGAMNTGWQWLDNKWYYFNKAGDMRYGWLDENGTKYYLGSSGAMVTGSQKIGGTWYYFNGDGSLAVSTNSYSNTEEFIQCIAPLVIKYAPQYNVKVYSPIIAQAILESASGESSLGKKYNNFFGLKCGTLWTGKSVNLRTGEEYTPGHYTTISANFRVFDTMEEGVRGYFEFLFRNRTRYNNLIGETDPYEYLVKIKEDGYATSSNYVRNVYNVIKSYNLTRFDP